MRFFTISLINIFLFLFAAGAFSQGLGDYRTSQSGNWNQLASWEVFDGSDWVPAMDYPNDPLISITIRSGHTIEYSNYNFNVQNVSVETNGRLYSNSTSNYYYLEVFGDIRVDGVIGNGEIVDGICLRPEGENTIISGSGECKFRRIRKITNTNTVTNLVFDMPVEIHYDGSGDALYNNAAGTILNITVNPGVTITLHSNLDLDDCTLILLSDAIGTAGIICPNVQNSSEQNTMVQQYIEKNNHWHFISSPVEDQAIQTEFVPSPIDNSFDFYQWHEDRTDHTAWENIRDDTGGVNPHFETIFTEGKGYLIAYDVSNSGSLVRHFRGTLNHGNKNLPVTSSLNAWNLIGNPFPCTLDWSSAGVDKSHVGGSAMYVWDQKLNGNIGGYRTHNGTIGTPAGTTSCIPAMNGFFVSAISGGNVAVDIDTDNPLISCSQSFYKSTIKPENYLRLMASNGQHSSELLVVMNENATNDFDVQFDAQKLFVFQESVPEIYSLDSDTLKLVINQFKEPPFSVPVYVNVQNPGNISFIASEIAGFEEPVQIRLLDKLLENEIDLKTTTNYEFYADSGDNANRFSLVFSSPVRIDVHERVQKTASIYYFDRKLHISDPWYRRGSLKIISIDGKTCATIELYGNKNTSIDVSEYRGIFIAELIYADEKTALTFFNY